MKRIGFLLSISWILLCAVAGEGDARNYQTWCKSYSTAENVACSTHTVYGGTYSYTPGVAPTIYNVPDNRLFNVKYEAAGHEQTLFSMYFDSQLSSCVKGTNCNYVTDNWKTRCLWNGVDGWVCTLSYQDEQISQFWLWTNNSVTNYVYLGLIGNKNSPPIITDVPPMSYPENSGTLSNIIDLWFYAGDDKTPKQNMIYTVANQTNPSVVSCSVSSNRYLSCSVQPSVNGSSDVTFSVKDAAGATTSSTFKITITPSARNVSTQTGEVLIIPSALPETAAPPPATSSEAPPEQ